MPEVLLAFAALMNVALLVFNLIPAFPLDGGRIARAVAWKLTGDRHSATRFAAALGQVFAVLPDRLRHLPRAATTTPAAASGTSCSAGCSAARPAPRWPSRAFIDAPRGRDGGRHHGRRAGDDPGRPARRAAYDEFFLRYQGWPWFAVVEDDGRFAGVAHRAAVEQVALSRTARCPSRAVAAAGEEVRTDTPLESLAGSEPLRRLGALMAVDADGRLRGVVTLEQVSQRPAGPPRAVLSIGYCAGPCPHTTS